MKLVEADTFASPMKPMLIDLKPVRKIRPSSRSITGKLASKKTNTTHYFESSLERDYLTLLEFDPQVYVFVAQPFTIFYTEEDVSRRYTPDVLVHYIEELNRQPLIVEIKYAAELELKKVELQSRFDAANRYAVERNFEFKVITEKQIRTPYLQNIKFLSRYRQSLIDLILAGQIAQQLEIKYPIMVQQLIDNKHQEKNATLLHTLWSMIAQNMLYCDMQNKLSMNTPVWIGPRN